MALGLTMALAGMALSPAQNLGLGTGSRSGAPGDSAQSVSGDPYPPAHEETPAPRKSSMNRRLGLSARKGERIDPKMFEARGRDLQGQFYEIGTPSKGDKNASSLPSLGQQKQNSNQWLIWVGIAGAAGVSAGAIGYYLMEMSHPAAGVTTVPINLSDDPNQK